MPALFIKTVSQSGRSLFNEIVIEGAQEFYLYTAACLPMWDSTEVLDLGCGTGLELVFSSIETKRLFNSHTSHSEMRARVIKINYLKLKMVYFPWLQKGHVLPL